MKQTFNQFIPQASNQQDCSSNQIDLPEPFELDEDDKLSNILNKMKIGPCRDTNVNLSLLNDISSI